MVRVTAGRYQVGTTTNGRDFTPIGPPWKTPRLALVYANAPRVPYVSPLRSGVPPTALSGSPLPGGGQVGRHA